MLICQLWSLYLSFTRVAASADDASTRPAPDIPLLAPHQGGLRVTSFSTLIRTRDFTSTDTFFSDYRWPPLLRFRSRDQPRAAGRTDWSCVLLHPFSILPLPFVSTFSGDSRLSASGCRRNQLHTGLHMAQLDQSFHPFSGNCTLHVVSSTGRLLLLWTLPLCCVADREPWVCWSRQLQHSIHSA
ncbi:hypothetical protein V8E36_008788 [Tilletia maclaganii]